jgi:hypothetical protein
MQEYLPFYKGGERISSPEITSTTVKLNHLHRSETMEISSSSSEKFENEYTGRNEYLKNELKSLGVEPKGKNQLNDKEELEDLADNIKQAMFQDYKVAYGEKGDSHKEEAQSTVTVG